MAFQSTRPRGARPSLGGGWRLLVQFQSTRPRGARLKGAANREREQRFQSTRPRGARRGRTAQPAHIVCFNPRAHVGRDSRLSSFGILDNCFNPRAHVGRDLVGGPYAQGCLFQSTRPRGARLKAPPQLLVLSVSIHAPTWGATEGAALREREQRFQSTRPRGARPLPLNPAPRHPAFQSTRPRGARRTDYKDIIVANVSIHAPTWGATCFGAWNMERIPVSIHAPTWGATTDNGPAYQYRKFQSTRPRGARH